MKTQKLDHLLHASSVGTTDVTNYTTGISTSSECTPCDCSSAATDVTKPVTGT